MPKLGIVFLLAGIFPVSSAYADGSLQGLEMDVMDAGELPAEATARIALPGASPAIDDGKSGDVDLAAAPAQAGSNGGQAPALEDASSRAPELAAETSNSLDTGAPDVGDGGGVVADDGGLAEGPLDGGSVDGSPGDIGVIDVEGPIVEIPVEEPPVQGPPVEIPIGELPGGDTPIDDTPGDGPPVEDVGGDPTGGDGVVPEERPGAEGGGSSAAGDRS